MSDGLQLFDGPSVVRDLKINGRIHWGEVHYEKEFILGAAGIFVDGVCFHKFRHLDMWQVKWNGTVTTGIVRLPV
jgi:hypothetical protein